jgi:hypothetical protein
MSVEGVRRDRAARSHGVSTRGTAQGAFVRSSKNGVGRLGPRIHQPSIFDARRNEIDAKGSRPLSRARATTSTGAKRAKICGPLRTRRPSSAGTNFSSA